MRRWTLALLCALLAGPALAQGYPTRPVVLVNPTAAGGTSDLLARAFAPALQARIGQPVAVVNRDGASGALGVASVARATADGYTLLFSAANTLAVVPVMQPDAGYTAASVTPLCQTFVNVMAIAVRPESGFATLADLVAAARANPGGVRYAHQGIGSIPHLAMLELAEAAGVRFQDVPYRGDAPAVLDTVAGRTDAGALVLGSLRGQNLRALAVFSATRHPMLPDTPTVREAGWNIAPESFGGLFGPANLPRAVVDVLATACAEAVKDPGYLEAARRAFQPPEIHLGPEAFAARLSRDVAVKARQLRALRAEGG